MSDLTTSKNTFKTKSQYKEFNIQKNFVLPFLTGLKLYDSRHANKIYPNLTKNYKYRVCSLPLNKQDLLIVSVYPSLNIVRVIKSRRMRWAGHVARMGEERGCIGSWWGNRREGTSGET